MVDYIDYLQKIGDLDVSGVVIVSHPHDLGGAVTCVIEQKQVDLVSLLKPERVIHEGAMFLNYSFDPMKLFVSKLRSLNLSNEFLYSASIQEDVVIDDYEREIALHDPYLFLKENIPGRVFRYVLENRIDLIGPELSNLEIAQTYANKTGLSEDEFDFANICLSDIITLEREKRFAKRILENPKKTVAFFGTYHLRPDSEMVRILNEKKFNYVIIDLEQKYYQ